MPIKGLTDNVRPAFPVLGKLHKGALKSENTPGRDLEYFRFATERPEVRQAFEMAYGAQPVTLQVFLPYPQVEENFDAWKEHWRGGGLMHRCDGETAVLWLGPDGKYHTEPRPCPGECQIVGRLTLLLPEMIKAGFVGYIVLETHSIHDIRAIQGALLAVAQARAGDERGLRGIEFTLRRVPEKISTPSRNGRVRREKWLVKIEPSADWVRSQLSATQLPEPTKPLLQPGSYEAEDLTPALPAPGEEPEEEEETPTPILSEAELFDEEEDEDEEEVVAAPEPPAPLPEPARPSQAAGGAQRDLHTGACPSNANPERREGRCPAPHRERSPCNSTGAGGQACSRKHRCRDSHQPPGRRDERQGPGEWRPGATEGLPAAQVWQ